MGAQVCAAADTLCPMTATPTSLDIAELVAATEGEILRLVADRDDPTRGLYEQVRYHLGLDGPDAPAGKRMRPLLGLLAYASITGEFEPALPGAAAVELGHNFSLVHDDIEDGDTERRHRPTLWSIHGIPQAINTGDTLFTLSRIALHRLTDLGFSDTKVLRLMRLYDLTCLALCEGQYIDIWTSEHDTPMSVELYFDMIGRKTAALIAASIEAGALLATDDEEVIARYRGFGWALGLAFQLNDDLLGIWGAEQATGKEPSDLARHKKTLPVLYALEHGTPEERERLTTLYSSPRPSRAEVDEAVSILERTGARDYTRDQARRYRDEAIAELDAAGVVLPEAREALHSIIVRVISA
jgi:geranylgeranyl diphosphate synthase type I